MTASEYPSCTLGPTRFPTSIHLVISRRLACEHNQREKLHKSLLSPVVYGSQVWLDLQPSKSCNFYPSKCQTCWLQTCHPSLTWSSTHPHPHPHTAHALISSLYHTTFLQRLLISSLCLTSLTYYHLYRRIIRTLV